MHGPYKVSNISALHYITLLYSTYIYIIYIYILSYEYERVCLAIVDVFGSVLVDHYGHRSIGLPGPGLRPAVETVEDGEEEEARDQEADTQPRPWGGQ